MPATSWGAWPVPSPLYTSVGSIDRLEVEVLSALASAISHSPGQKQEATGTPDVGPQWRQQSRSGKWTPKQWDSRSSRAGLSGNVMRGLW